MQKTAENSAFSNGIRGLTVMNGKLLVSLATDGADPDHMFENGSQLSTGLSELRLRTIAKKDVRYKMIIQECKVHAFLKQMILKM